MKRIGIDLEALASSPPLRPSNDECPGALLLVTRDEYDEMVRNGEMFATKRADVPAEGRGDARVVCTGLVLRWERHGRMYYSGLCASCTEAERLMRERARERHVARGQR